MTPPTVLTAVAVVGVCTFNRPEQLRRLLRGVADACTQTGEPARIDLLVVDDGDAVRADAVVEAESDRFLGQVRYHRLGSGDLAAARNAVLEIGTEMAPWVVFIDDDCVPEPDWLAALPEVQRRTDADVVTGHVRYTPGPGAPRWLVAQPFCETDVYDDGEEPELGTTANTLVRSSFVVDNAIRFRSTLGRTGGEDMTFFHDVRAAGGRLRHAAKAVVIEELTPARQTYRYHLRRQLWLGNNVVEINRHTHALTNGRLLLRGCRWSVRACTDALQRVRRREPADLRWTVALASRGVGLVLGLLGVRLRHQV